MEHIENTLFPTVSLLLRAYSFRRERVYRVVAQKLALYIRLSRSHCIAKAVHATIYTYIYIYIRHLPFQKRSLADYPHFVEKETEKGRDIRMETKKETRNKERKIEGRMKEKKEERKWEINKKRRKVNERNLDTLTIHESFNISCY
jgi:hypothetical protein